MAWRTLAGDWIPAFAGMARLNGFCGRRPEFCRISGTSYMQIVYNSRTDVLYLRLDDRIQDVINERVFEDMVLDMGEGGKIVGIEILDASKRLDLERLLPLEYRVQQ